MMYLWNTHHDDQVLPVRRKRQSDALWNLAADYLEYNYSDYDYPGGWDYGREEDQTHFFYPGDVGELRKPWVKEPHVIPVVTVYTLTFIFGICGNTLVIFSLLKFHRSRSITTPFLTSLAVADLLFLLVCVPYETTRYFIGHWALGRAFCKISGFVEMLTAVASILNLTAVSVERYLMLVHPLKSRPPWTNVLIKRVLIVVWILSFGVSSPVLYVMTTENTTYFNNQSSVVIVFCADVGIPDDHRLVFAVYQLVVMFAAPLLVMACCYSRVIHALWISTKDLRNLTEKNLGDITPCSSYSSLLRPFYLRRKQYIFQRGAKTRSMKILEARRQVIKMLCAIVVVFFLSWGPKLIFRTLQRQGLQIMFNPEAFTTKLILDCLPYLQSCINPVIYGFMSRAFRKSVRAACTSTCSLTQEVMCFEKRLMASEFALQQRNLAPKDTYLNEKTNLMTRHMAEAKAVK